MRPEKGDDILVTTMGSGGPPSSWRKPTPYILLGLAFIMGAIAVALLVLICTSKKASSSWSDEKVASALTLLDREPKVVIFMPGDHAPSFLASAKQLGGDGAAPV